MNAGTGAGNRIVFLTGNNTKEHKTTEQAAEKENAAKRK